MDEYIEREALLEKIARMINYAETNGMGRELTVLFQVGDAVMDCPAADVAPVVPELRPVVRLLHKEYERAKKNPVVRNPMAFALYQTWKAVDECENGR